MKTNFETKKNISSADNNKNSSTDNTKEDLTEEQFEELVSRSGAAGSFMIFRSQKKDDELGLDEL
ncbi:MAG: hypothetical protein WAN80_03460 [Nitrosotalea sp.]